MPAFASTTRAGAVLGRRAAADPTSTASCDPFVISAFLALAREEAYSARPATAPASHTSPALRRRMAYDTLELHQHGPSAG